MDISPLSAGWTGCFPREAISHLLNERENDVEPIVVVHKPCRPVARGEGDRSDPFYILPALGALEAISPALIDCQSPSS
jgi:hypothetical protein